MTHKFIAKNIYEPARHGWYDYEPMINAFGNAVLIEKDDDYQGDTRVLYHNGDKWGYLCFGWGSCSGCDALQACENYDDLQNLIDEAYNSIRWFDDAVEALQFFIDHDWQGDYDYSRSFVDNAVELLQKECQ